MLLSFRRTAWIGLLLAGILLFAKMRPSLRFAGVAVALPLLSAGLLYVFMKRFSQQAGHYGLTAVVYDLLETNNGVVSPRALELRLATAEFLKSPFVGVGAWGRYAQTILIPWQDPARPGAFLHSGFLHVMMKTGILGLGLTLGVIWSFTRQVLRTKDRSPEEAALIFAGCCGLLFMLPDFIIGTPVPQIRTMQLLAACVALPFVVERVRALSKAA